MSSLLVVSLALNVTILAAALFVVQKNGGVGYIKAKYYELTEGSTYTDPRRPFYESTAFRQRVSVHEGVPVR